MKKILSAILIALMALMILNASAETAAILTPDGMEWTAPRRRRGSHPRKGPGRDR